MVIPDWNGEVRVLRRRTGNTIASFNIYSSDDPNVPSLGEWANGHATIANVDESPANEIILAGAATGRVIVLGANGASEQLQVVYASDSLPGGAYVDGSGPAVADLDGDGQVEIVVAASGSPAIYAFSVEHGSQCKYKWTATSGSDYYWTSPVIADVDGDGRNEVVVFSVDSVLSVLSAPQATPGECQEGVIEWEYVMDDGAPAWFTPALGQLTGGDAIDVVVASETTLEVVDVQARTVAYRFVDPTAQFYPSAVVAPGSDGPNSPAAHIFVSGWSNGAVYRLDTNPGAPRPNPWVGYMGGNERTGTPAGSL